MSSSAVYRICTGLVLLLLLGIPTFVPALHELLHYHRHQQCTAALTDVHLHEKVYDCELCNYLTQLTYIGNDEAESVKGQEPNSGRHTQFQHPTVQQFRGLQQLRGPPAIV